jgi:uncharacterized Zn-binding protein involved in type VI secretion
MAIKEGLAADESSNTSCGSTTVIVLGRSTASMGEEESCKGKITGGSCTLELPVARFTA